MAPAQPRTPIPTPRAFRLARRRVNSCELQFRRPTWTPWRTAPSSPPPSRRRRRRLRRRLRRWRRIHREHHKEVSPSVGGAAGDDTAQLHKRRLPLGAAAPPKGKQEATAEGESSTASVESRFVPLEPAPAKLDPDLGLLVTSVGFSVGAGGADSHNSEERTSRPSTAASAPRHDFVREQDTSRDHTAAASLHGKNRRTARARADKPLAHSDFSPAEAENSRSSVESTRQSSNTVNSRKLAVRVVGNGVHEVLSDGDDHSDEVQPNEEDRSTARVYSKQNGSSVVGRLVRESGDSSADADAEDTLNEGSVGKDEDGSRTNSGADPFAESILLLQRTHEALANEIQNFVLMGEESTEDFDGNVEEWSESLHLEEPIEEASEKEKDLETRMEQASALIKEKDSRILELEALSRTRAWRSAIQTTNSLLLQPDLDQLLQEKMEAEIQCIILTRASQNRPPLAHDRKALYKEQKCLLGNYKQLELKFRRAENRATILREIVEKLEVQCKELSASSEILQLKSRASTLSLFCFIQFILLLFAIGIFLVRLSPFSTEFVPT